MGFTMLLLLVYIIMSGGSIIAFKKSYKTIGMLLLFAIVLSILILGYMWIHSPM